MLRRLFSIGVVAIIFVGSVLKVQRPAKAGTIGALVNAGCPNGPALKAAADAADESLAIDDRDATSLSREAARQYYRCAQATNKGYVHDWARFFYFTYLWSSFTTKGDVCSGGKPVLDGLSELGDTSQFDDVRAAAVKYYNAYDREFENVSAALSTYGCGE